MAHVEPGDAHDEMRERLSCGRDCACRHDDARRCLEIRYRTNIGPDDRCECYCHTEADGD